MSAQTYQGIDPKILTDMQSKFITVVKKYRLRSIEPYDVVYEFFYKVLRVSEQDGKNYLERYDGSSTPATWLYRPLHNLCISMLNRENSKGGFAITTAKSIEETVTNEEDFKTGSLFLDNYLVGLPV